MSGPDPEFEEFLQRRRPLFRRDIDDGLEPPAELDRIVLRRARAAIEEDRPLRMFRMPHWAATVAIAATLVLGISIVFRAAMPPDPVPQVTVENISQRTEVPAAAETREAEALGAPMGTARAAAQTTAADAPAWRRDARSWLAEIERLRASGDAARADAEMAEYNRQHRAYATSPDR